RAFHVTGVQTCALPIYAVAAIDYRLAPAHPWPAQREDTHLALAWLKANATKLGIAADKLVLFGRSAGGQIAAAVGCTANDPAIRSEERRVGDGRCGARG